MKIFDAITNIRDDIIERADSYKFNRRHRLLWVAPTAAVLAVTVALSVLFWRADVSQGLVVAAATPVEVSELDYGKLYRHTPQNLTDFFESSITQYISGGENTAYSPYSAYFSLAMMAECAAGDSRQQILDTLGCDDIEQLRSQAKLMWETVYGDDNGTTLASSAWVQQGMEFNGDTLEALSTAYYASLYAGDLNAPSIQRLLDEWTEQNSDGMLKGTKLPDGRTLMLVNAMSFENGWAEQFDPKNNTVADFYAEGGTVSAEYMNAEETLIYGDYSGYDTAVRMFDGGSAIRFILPDEGVSVEQALARSMSHVMILNKAAPRQQVKLSVPKFEVRSEHDLVGGFEALGVTDVFDSERADLTALSADLEMHYIAKSAQGAAVRIDEKGGAAASVDVNVGDSYGEAKGEPEAPAELILDRPFIFVIYSETAIPLFVGVVADPTA